MLDTSHGSTEYGAARRHCQSPYCSCTSAKCRIRPHPKLLTHDGNGPAVERCIVHWILGVTREPGDDEWILVGTAAGVVMFEDMRPWCGMSSPWTFSQSEISVLDDSLDLILFLLDTCCGDTRSHRDC